MHELEEHRIQTWRGMCAGLWLVIVAQSLFKNAILQVRSTVSHTGFLASVEYLQVY